MLLKVNRGPLSLFSESGTALLGLCGFEYGRTPVLVAYRMYL
jgi:hypothetical protein